jgi:hypothetical protein
MKMRADNNRQQSLSARRYQNVADHIKIYFGMVLPFYWLLTPLKQFFKKSK